MTDDVSSASLAIRTEGNEPVEGLSYQRITRKGNSSCFRYSGLGKYIFSQLYTWRYRFPTFYTR